MVHNKIFSMTRVRKKIESEICFKVLQHFYVNISLSDFPYLRVRVSSM